MTTLDDIAARDAAWPTMPPGEEPSTLGSLHADRRYLLTLVREDAGVHERLLALLGPSHPHDEGRDCGTCAAYNLLALTEGSDRT